MAISPWEDVLIDNVSKFSCNRAVLIHSRIE